MFAMGTIRDFLHTANEKVGGYLWAIFAAAVVLLIVILFIVIAAKNKRIKKLKKEIKNTRTQLETEREQLHKEISTTRSQLENEREQLHSERARAEKDRKAYEAAVASIDAAIDAALVDDDDTKIEEIESFSEPAPTDDETARVGYYTRTSVVSSKEGGTVKFTVKYDRNKDSWVIKKEGVERVVRRFDTKEEAMNCARMLCKKYNANLVVHKKDGRFQKQ